MLVKRRQGKVRPTSSFESLEATPTCYRAPFIIT